LIIHDKYLPTIIHDDPVAQFDSSKQTDHGKPDDSRNANDFLNDLPSKFESNEEPLGINTDNNIEATSDSPSVSGDGTSDDKCHVNDVVNAVSTRPDDDKKLIFATIIIHHDIAVWSSQGSSFECKYWS
jgi:hypothetical protein